MYSTYIQQLPKHSTYFMCTYAYMYMHVENLLCVVESKSKCNYSNRIAIRGTTIFMDFQKAMCRYVYTYVHMCTCIEHIY